MTNATCSAVVSVKGLVGKRVLLRALRGGFGVGARMDVEEYRLLEVSPSGGYVRLQNACGMKFWRSVEDLALVEELHPLERCPEGGK